MIASPSPDPDLRLVNHQTQPNVIIIITIKQTKSFRSYFKLTIFINGFLFNRGFYFIRFSVSVPHRIVDCWQEAGPVRGHPRNFSVSTSRILMRWLATLLTSPGNQQSPSSRILESRPKLCPECAGLCNGWSGPHLVIVSLLNTKYPGSHVLNLGVDMSHYVLKCKVIYWRRPGPSTPLLSLTQADR